MNYIYERGANPVEYEEVFTSESFAPSYSPSFTPTQAPNACTSIQVGGCEPLPFDAVIVFDSSGNKFILICF